MRTHVGALRELGVSLESAESHFKHIASRLLCVDSGSDDKWCRFWALARDVKLPGAEMIITNQRLWRGHLRVRTQVGAWAPMHRVLLPGRIVPGPNRRDRQAAIDP